jgi:hypothetical protein
MQCMKVLWNISTGFACGSIEVGGISTLEERYRVLEAYMGLKANFISGSRQISLEEKLVPESLHYSYGVS